MKLYLAHGYSILKATREWELGFERRTGIDLVNPFYDLGDRSGELTKRIKKSKKECYKIVTRDLNAIESCDGLLAMVEEKAMNSYGTAMEIQHAAWALHKPVYIISQNYWIREHPWIKTHATKIFKNKALFEKWIRRRK
jgi:nucleoside 2-deoxyribosyltransferase